MSKTITLAIVSFFSGSLFAVGLAVSGMTQPQKVIGFLDVWSWDPSLIFVMVGAIAVHAVAYPLVRKRSSPILEAHWQIPTRRDITSRLVIGAAIFGVGWGLGGFCPGPGLTSLVSGDVRAVAFVLAMIAGMLLFRRLNPFIGLRE